MAIGILNGALDEKIMKDGFSEIANRTYKSYVNYINHVRESEKRDKA